MNSVRTISEEELRKALGNALLKINNDFLQSLSKNEILVMNKVALRLIRNILTELNITDWSNLNG